MRLWSMQPGMQQHFTHMQAVPPARVHCTALLQLQLQQATYSAATVPVLCRVAEEVEGALAGSSAQLQQVGWLDGWALRPCMMMPPAGDLWKICLPRRPPIMRSLTPFSPQARLQLEQYRSMGPQYHQLAREHAAVVEALAEVSFELREVEQFRVLARVTG